MLILLHFIYDIAITAKMRSYIHISNYILHSSLFLVMHYSTYIMYVFWSTFVQRNLNSFSSSVGTISFRFIVFVLSNVHSLIVKCFKAQLATYIFLCNFTNLKNSVSYTYTNYNIILKIYYSHTNHALCFDSDSFSVNNLRYSRVG